MGNYKVEAVEGIGPVLGQKLRSAGITDTDTLLQAVTTPAKRSDLAKKTEIPEKNILRFANMVDLFRIKGIGPQYAELLEVSGVDTVKEMAQRVPQNLLQKMEEVNAQRHICGRVPTEKELIRWVSEAKELPRTIEY